MQHFAAGQLAENRLIEKIRGGEKTSRRET